MTLNNLGEATYKGISDAGELTTGFTVHGYRVDEEEQEAFLVITNSKCSDETTGIHVRKTWNDTLDHSGDSVTVYLVVDGVRIREVTLSAANDWQNIWENMPMYYQDGVTEIQYLVQEGTVPGYIGRAERITEAISTTIKWETVSAFESGQTYLLYATYNGTWKRIPIPRGID